MTIETEELRKLLANVTPGRRVQFHPSYCPEANGSRFTDWDTSHDTSVILPDGKRYRGYARHKHANDAALDALAPDLAAEVLRLRAENEQMRDALMAIQHGDDSPDGMQGDIARAALKKETDK